LEGAIGVARSAAMGLTFSEAVVANTGAVTLTGPRGAIPATVVASGSQITVTPSRPLGFGEAHTLAVTSALRDAAGNAHAGSAVHFTSKPRSAAMGLGAMLTDTYLRYRFSQPSTNPWDVMPALADNGIGRVRVGVTTLSFPELRTRSDWYNLGFQNGYWSCLEVAGATLQNAAKQGARLHAMLYFSDAAANAGVQARPAAWAGLSEADVAVKIEEHARTVATYYQSLGLAIEVFEIGNEIDFGFCGWQLGSTVPVTAGADPVNDPVWMRDHLWVNAAPLLKAGIRGVLSVYPGAKILLHVAGFGYSTNNVAATGFFQSMTDLGVRFDIAGYSFPYMFDSPAVTQPYFAQAEFINALTRTTSTFGKPVQIVELAYPASSNGATLTPASAYPFTPEGQAAFITDFATAVRGKVEAMHYFYPDYYPGFDSRTPNLEGGGLFASPGVPRPALAVFNAIAEGRLLA
jgi:arabinogalactan endo-1,4-beta-galactosidase